MPRLAPTVDVIRALFARSGNQCAFPGCTQPLINDKNQFIGQICHIEAALPEGQRYNPNQTHEERRGYENLVLFCYPHHIETNDVSEYKVERLKRIKREHEARFEKLDFKIDEVALFKIMDEMERYWTRIERLNTLEHSMAELAFEINAKGSFLDLIKACQENIGYISGFHDAFRASDEKLQADFNQLLERKGINPKVFDDIPYYENPFQNRNWEIHNLGIPNRMQRLKIDLMHIEIKYLEEFLKTNSKNQEARERLEYLKEAFAELAQHAMVVD
jgi:hypothetical protein